MLFRCYRVICSTQQGRGKWIKINLHAGEHLGKAELVSKRTASAAERKDGSKAVGGVGGGGGWIIKEHKIAEGS